LPRRPIDDAADGAAGARCAGRRACDFTPLRYDYIITLRRRHFDYDVADTFFVYSYYAAMRQLFLRQVFFRLPRFTPPLTRHDAAMPYALLLMLSLRAPPRFDYFIDYFLSRHATLRHDLTLTPLRRWRWLPRASSVLRFFAIFR